MVRRQLLWLILFEFLLECHTAPRYARLGSLSAAQGRQGNAVSVSDEGNGFGAQGADVARERAQRRPNRFLLQSVEPIVILSGPTENEVVSPNDFPIVFRVPGNAATECLLSKGGETVRDWFLCTSPLPLREALAEEAEYTLRIHIVGDPAMAVQSAAVVTFRVDLTEPNTKITSVKRSRRDPNDFSFEFGGVGKDVAFFQCESDYSSNWDRCQSPKKIHTVVHGVHAFRVRAVDEAGNVDSSPAEAIFEVETPYSPPPVVERPPRPSPSPPPPALDSSSSAPPPKARAEPKPEPSMRPVPEPPPATPPSPSLAVPSSPSPSPPPPSPSPRSDPEPSVESVPESNRGNAENSRRNGNLDGEISTGESATESVDEAPTSIHTISWDLWMTLVIVFAFVGAVIIVTVAVILCCTRDSDPCCGGGRCSAVQDDGGLSSTAPPPSAPVHSS